MRGWVFPHQHQATLRTQAGCPQIQFDPHIINLEMGSHPTDKGLSPTGPFSTSDANRKSSTDNFICLAEWFFLPKVAMRSTHQLPESAQLIWCPWFQLPHTRGGLSVSLHLQLLSRPGGHSHVDVTNAPKLGISKIKPPFPFSDLLILYFLWQWLCCLPRVTEVYPGDILAALSLIPHHQFADTC